MIRVNLSIFYRSSLWLATALAFSFLCLYLGTNHLAAQRDGPDPKVREIIKSLNPEDREIYFSLSHPERRAFIGERLSRQPNSSKAPGMHGGKRQKGFRYLITTDGGQTWAQNFSPVTNMSTKGGVDPEAFVGVDGKVWIYYFGSNNTRGDPARNQPDNTWRILLAKSADNGATFVEKGLSYSENEGLTDPFVLQLEDGSYRMYISRGASVFSALSKDGRDFSVENGLRVREGRGGVPGALLLDDGSTVIFVCRRNGIYRAVSEDGLEFNDFELALEAPDGKMICDPSPEKVKKDLYVMAYKEKPEDVRGPRQDYVRIATSKDGLEWHKRKGVAGSGSVPALLVFDESNWKIFVSGPPVHLKRKHH